MLEITFEEMDNDIYSKAFEAALLNRYQKVLTLEQRDILAATIEQARLNGQNPVDLAINLGENFEEIF